jgi:hypothetical protein
MSIRAAIKEIPTTGTAGSATGSAVVQARAERLLGIQVLYADGQPATVDVTVTNGNRTLLALANSNTGRVVQPQVVAQDSTGADTTDHVTPVVDGPVQIAVAQANPAQRAVTAKLFLEA